MKQIFTVVGLIVVGLGLLFLISLILSLPVMWLWNWVCVDVFDLKEITWLHAWGLSLLSGILFSSHSPKKS